MKQAENSRCDQYCKESGYQDKLLTTACPNAFASALPAIRNPTTSVQGHEAGIDYRSDVVEASPIDTISAVP